jgi:hypothetical protein
VARWFCRATIRVALAGRKASLAQGERLALALLVAEHVWGDAGFVVAVKARLQKRAGWTPLAQSATKGGGAAE